MANAIDKPICKLRQVSALAIQNAINFGEELKMNSVIFYVHLSIKTTRCITMKFELQHMFELEAYVCLPVGYLKGADSVQFIATLQ